MWLARAAGKDRTGLIIALLLLTLGVPEEVVVLDYAKSEVELKVCQVSGATFSNASKPPAMPSNLAKCQQRAKLMRITFTLSAFAPRMG